MRAEVENPGRSEHLRASVAGVMALYDQADHLVSVSPSLNELNRERLADCAPPDRFTYARNTINWRTITHLAYGQTPEVSAERAHITPPDPDRGLPGWIDELMSHYGITNVVDEVDRRATLMRVLPSQPRVRTFVTAGRLSKEKNHARLIEAFDLVHQEDPETRLVIMGSGSLRTNLAALIDELGLASAVSLAGHQHNPYTVLANSDCFVLSSDYEGQPMVLLEALVLNLPVVTTSFGSVRGALPPDTGLIVERSTKALADGMRAFLRGEVPSRPFDAAAYNREAVDEFLEAIGALS
jgi:glycosyltransferase involved in cell wall biosynthesis